MVVADHHGRALLDAALGGREPDARARGGGHDHDLAVQQPAAPAGTAALVMRFQERRGQALARVAGGPVRMLAAPPSA